MDKYLGTVMNSRYEILEIIGNGGMAIVYKARDLRLNRLVAIKILKDDAFADEELRLRFRTESEAVAQLNHPNIVNIFDVSSNEDMEYIVMELVDGITLHQYMKKRGVLPLKEVLFFVTQMLKALDHAHSRNIVHQDIKPQNMMLLRDGTLKVTDFGIARITSRQKPDSSNAFGSVHYIAPEQARGEQTDGRTDIYSVGVILYEMVTGRLPFEGDTPLAIALQHVNSETTAPSKLRSDLPKSFEDIILKAMAMEPERRYPTAVAMLADIEEFKRDPNMVVEQIPVREEGEDVFETKKIERIDRIETHDPQSAEEGNTRRVKKPREAKGKMVVPMIAGIATAVLFVVVAAGLLVWALFSSGGGTNVTMPSITNMTVAEAEAFLAADPLYANLKIVVESERNDAHVAKNDIIEQKPAANKTVRSTATINVTVSLGPVTVLLNDVTGKSVIEGTNAIKTYLSSNGLTGLSYQNRYETSDTVPKDAIIRTEPAAGQDVKEGDLIILYVSSGPQVETIPMPALLDLDLATAKQILEDNKLIANVLEQYSDKPEGTVILQSVLANNPIQQGSTVNITVSIGLEPDVQPTTDPSVPDVTPVYRTYTITLPAREETYQIIITQDGSVVYQNDYCPMEGGTVDVTFTGVIGGSSNVQILLNGEVTNSMRVDFTE